MNPESGFTDLRLNRQDGTNQENFWPSFTDIMTVIVMIFMIAMVTLLLRNIELVNQLRATMDAERTAMELAKTTGEEKESLALKLITAENDISMLQIQLMRLEEERQTQEKTIGAQTSDLSKLQSDLVQSKQSNQQLKLRVDQLVAEKYTLTQQLDRTRSELSAKQHELNTTQNSLTTTEQLLAETQQQLIQTGTEVERLQSNYKEILEQLALLQASFNEQSSALLSAQSTERQTGQALSALKSDMESLQVKYNRLVRPARSPAGRYLVEVRYTKSDGKLNIEYRPEQEATYQPVSQQALEQALKELKSTHSAGLYVKLIFPEDSGLSFNEAWSFTSRLHSRYDYYFQDGAATPVPIAIPAIPATQ